jgi:molybdopterin-guanine dinucleotide biosynthesis protein B
MKVFGIAGFSGSGKTTLMEGMIPAFALEGLKVSVIKHAHHHFDVDRPGKDSYRHREAGASEVLISGGQRWVLMHELRGSAEPSLEQLVGRFSPCDIVLVEGFKNEPIPKLEVHRAGSGRPLLYPNDSNIVAIATDEPLDSTLPQLDVNHPDSVAQFIMQYLGFCLEGARLLA